MGKQNRIVVVIGILLTTACVSKKAYKTAETNITRLQTDSTSMVQQSDSLLTTINTLTDSFENYKSLQEQRTASLMAQMDKKTELLSEKEGVLTERANRLREMQSQLFDQNERMKILRRSMRKALVDIPAKDLELEMRNGKLYINLSENLLFASGSAIVDIKGREALKSVAEVLTSSPDLQIEIIGHTDSIPIRTARFSDNWDLSVARATSITRVLVEDYNISGTRIKSSGRSEHNPISTNENPEGRAKNRRTEIIISPKLELLYQLLED